MAPISVEYNFVFRTLEKFDFKDNFIGMIKTLDNDLSLKLIILIGYQNHVQCATIFRQGCPVCAVLFIVPPSK